MQRDSEYKSKIGNTLYSAEEISSRVQDLGKQITFDYEDKIPLFICVLKGAYAFMTDLVRSLDIPIEVDFMAVASYGSSRRTSGVVRLVKDLDVDIADRHVILVEDIVDSGLTLTYLRRSLEARGPASLKVCSLMVRGSQTNKHSQDIDYVGFRLPEDQWVIGYGLDADQKYRNLPYIASYKK